MQRSIKFRAWDKHNKCFRDEYELGDRIKISLDGRIYYDNELVNWELMQYTGLKDKNGKEIWEGDIVGIPYVNLMGGVDDEWSYKAKVIYDFGCFWVDYEDKGEFPVSQQIVDWTEKKKGKYIPNFGEPTIYQNKVRLEVIGNIYENKDLLNQTK